MDFLDCEQHQRLKPAIGCIANLAVADAVKASSCPCPFTLTMTLTLTSGGAEARRLHPQGAPLTPSLTLSLGLGLA